MIRSKTTPKEIVIDLTGPQGNAFFLLANATTLAKQLGFNTFKIFEEMKEGDYKHRIKTFDKYFGEYVILER